MLVCCSSCTARLRIDLPAISDRLVTFDCPRCGTKQNLRIPAPPELMILIAHEDQAICQWILARLDLLPFPTRICREPSEVVPWLKKEIPCLLLLDVAFAGGFPFALIERVKQQRDGVTHKVILLPSIYNKTAYKKRPTSLYGADAYLELHHVGDGLLPIIAEHYPHLRTKIVDFDEGRGPTTERDLVQGNLSERAWALSRMLIADMALYHQDRLSPGLASSEAQELFADCLREGRQLLLQRLPETADQPVDFLQLAFDEFFQSYVSHQIKS